MKRMKTDRMGGKFKIKRSINEWNSGNAPETEVRQVQVKVQVGIVGYRWKGLDFKIVKLPFIMVVYEFKIKRKVNILNCNLIFDKLSSF
jgi:hypothetical protein